MSTRKPDTFDRAAARAPRQRNAEATTGNSTATRRGSACRAGTTSASDGDARGELARALPRSPCPAPPGAAPLRQAVVSPQKMARLRKQKKAPHGRSRDALFHPRRQVQRRAAGAGPNEALPGAAGRRAAGPTRSLRAGRCTAANAVPGKPRRRPAVRAQAVRVQIVPAPRMRPLVAARYLVREGAEDYRAHPSRLMPGHYEGYWAPDKMSR